jgi:large subunit ribosomal protein L21
MYAVIETGGKQYRVELGSELAIERLDAAPGETVNFERVLLVADGDAAQVGTPLVAEALVTGEVLRQDRGEKLIVFKYRPKARHRSKKGHRQEQTVIRVADIRFNGRSAADEAGVQEKQQTKARKAAAAEAEQKAAADQALAAKLAQAAEAQADEASEAPVETSTKKPATKATTTKATTAKATTAKATTTKPAAAKATGTKASSTKPATKTTTAKATKSANAEAKAPKADATDTKPARTPRTTKKDE